MISIECLAALKSYRQADNEGVMVLVSREALDEAIATLTAATSGGVDDAILEDAEKLALHLESMDCFEDAKLVRALTAALKDGGGL